MPNRTYVNPTTGEINDEVEPRPFDQVLRELGEGTTLSELSEGFWDLLQRVQETARAGSITLTVHVGFDQQNRVVVKDEVKTKLPEFKRPETRFFLDQQGNASRRDPNQPLLPSLDEHRNNRQENAQ